VRQARWVTDENLHLTLRFIGEVEEPQVEEIEMALRSVRCEAFSLSLDGVGRFKTGRRIRSLWAGVAPNEALSTLQERVDGALRRAGLPPDGRRFTPHVTLARLKSGTPERVGTWMENNAAFWTAPFPVDAFVLFESYRSHTGAIYTPLARFEL
jgi:2'-5' RNA ligase